MTRSARQFAGGTDGPAVRTGKQDARVVGVGSPRTDRAEIGEDIPDILRASRDGPGAVTVGHPLTLRDYMRETPWNMVSSVIAVPLAAIVIPSATQSANFGRAGLADN